MARKRGADPPKTNGDHVTAPVPVDDPPPPQETHEYPPESEGNRPCHVVKLGFIRISVWANHTDAGVRYNCTAVRIYRGSDDNWYTSTSFGYRELLPLAKAIDMAHTWITQAYAEDQVPF